MKAKNLTMICMLLSASVSLFAQVKIGNNPNTINANSLLEMETTNKGFLPPRVAINSLTSVSPLSGTVPAGMLLYSSGGSVSDGYYYWNGTKWLNFFTQSNSWGNLGNSGTNYSNFWGTTDNVSLRIRTNNTEQVTIDSTGKVGMGITSPQTLLHLHNPTTALGGVNMMQFTTGFTNGGNTPGPLNGFIIGIENVGGSHNVRFITEETGNFEFYGGNSEAFYIKSTGNVGVGNSASNPNSTLQVGGSVATNVNKQTGATYTIVSTDYTVLCNYTSGTMTVTLPTASGIAGRIYVIKNICTSNKNVTVATSASQTIDGSSTTSLQYLSQTYYTGIAVQSDGTNWYIISRF